MRFEAVAALITHIQPYRETSALVRFFTRDEGRISTVMRGVRGASKVRHAGVQTFAYGELSVVGRGELSTVTRFDPHPPFMLHGDNLNSGFYVLELINRGLAEHQAEPGVFDLVIATLEALVEAHSGAHQAIILRRFERRLLSELGFGMDLTYDVVGQSPIEADGVYEYVPEQGVRRCETKSANGYPAEILLAIDQEKYDEAVVRNAAKAIFREALIPLIGHKPLVSRGLIQPSQPSQKRGSE